MLRHIWQENDSIAFLYSASGIFTLAGTCSNRKLRSLRMDLMSFSTEDVLGDAFLFLLKGSKSSSLSEIE